MMIKLKIFLSVLIIFLVLSDRLNAQKKAYILITDSIDAYISPTSYLLLEPTNGLEDGEQCPIIYLEDKLFKLKLLAFPKGNDDIMSCCELGQISFSRSRLVSYKEEIGFKRFNELAKYYQNIYTRIKEKFEQLIKSLRKNQYQLSIKKGFNFSMIAVELELCDCVYEFAVKNQQLPSGFEAYVKSILKIKKLKPKNRVFFSENLEKIIIEFPILFDWRKYN